MKINIKLEYEFEVADHDVCNRWIDWLEASPKDTIAQLNQTQEVSNFQVNSYHSGGCYEDRIPCDCGLFT